MGLYNRAAFMLRLLKDRLTRGRTPLVVVLNTTFRCNLRCGYCYGEYFQRTDPDFTTEELCGLIDSLGKMGTRSITLGGGEPLVRNDIGRIIERIKGNGIECGFNTNGTLVAQRIEELKKADMICVSIDGPPEMNDLNRGPGSFDRIVAGIDAALAAGIKVHTTTVITRHNVNAVDWMVDFARKKQIQAEFNFLFHQTKEKNQSDSFMATNEEIRAAALRIAELKAQGAPILFSERVYRYVADWPDHRQRVLFAKPDRFRHIPCFAGRFMMFIDADGKVYPCVQLIDTFAALDFRQVGLAKAWENCARIPCKTCYFPCFNEFNLIMGMNPNVIVQQVLSTLKGH
jgi:MoaA/NifB/PqqE/SkfB family radical SAM enzyme